MNKTGKKLLQFTVGLAVAVLTACVTPWLITYFVPCVLIVLYVVLAAPLTGFTFTNAVDFAPIGIVLLSFAGLALRHAIRPYPNAWTRTARFMAYVLAVLPPLIYLGALYGLAWCAYNAIGHFPREMIDDPKNIAPNDTLYQQMRHFVNYAEAFSGAFIWAWAALLLHLRRRLTRKDWVVLLCLFLIGWIMFLVEPGQRFSWWMD